jgi:ATP-dependent Clp protease ATP-binding subunit ClpC
VGKTQAAKVLSEFILGGEDQLIRFDMNEFIDAGAATRLIGDAHNPEGQLTGKVRYNPFGIVLLDEIEKAHPKVHDLLLQVLDDGRLTDSSGRTVDFSNTIIIMTSNVGADQVSARVGFEPSASEVDAVYRKAVENRFRPEFINRIDKIIIFQSLKQEHILGIARLQINELLKRDGFVRRTTILNISEEALRWVSSRGFDEKMGGRALKRQIEKDLTALSAEQLITADSGTPVIMDILLKGDRLYPRITLLDFEEAGEANWLPKLPSEKHGGRFYGQLLLNVEDIEQKIRDHEEREHDNDSLIIVDDYGDDLNWQYYDFKDSLAATKEKVRDTRMGFRDKFFKGGPAIPFRLKGGGLSSYVQRSYRNSTKAYRELLRDKLFQKQALNELNEFYRLASAQFDSINTEFIDNYLDVAFLALRAKGFLKGRADVVEIRYLSAIEGKGLEELAYIMKLHGDYFSEAGIQFEVKRQEEVIIIVAEAHSLYPLFKGEEGIHLFYRPHQTPLPIRVEIFCDDYPDAKRKIRVIRLYDTQHTLTDLRSGLSNAADITPNEFKLLLFSGLDEKVRDRLVVVG